MADRRLLGDLVRSVYLPGFLMFLGYGMTAPVVPLYASALGASLLLTGFIVSLRGFGPLVSDLPSGIILSRIGNRKLLLISTFGALVSALATGALGAITPLAVFTFLAGTFQSAWSLTRVTYIRMVVPPHQRGRAIAAIGGLIRIGGFAGPIAGGYVAQHMGFAATFYLQATLIAVALALYLLPTTRVEAPAIPVTSRPFAEIGSIVRTHYRSFLTIGLVAIAFSVVRSARATVAPLWGDAISLNVAQIGLALGLSSGLDMLLFVPAGVIMDRFGRKWCSIPSLAIMSLSLLVLPLSQTFASFLIVGLVAGFGNGFGAGIVMTLGSDLAPDNNTGTFLGVWFLVSGIGATVGPLLIGMIADAVDLGLASVITAIIGFAGALLFLFLRETNPGRR